MLALQGTSLRVPDELRAQISDLIRVDRVFYKVNFQGTDIGETWSMAQSARFPMWRESLNIFLYLFLWKLTCTGLVKITRPISSPYELVPVKEIRAGDIVFQKFDDTYVANKVKLRCIMEDSVLLRFDFREGMYLPLDKKIWRKVQDETPKRYDQCRIKNHHSYDRW